MVNEKYVENDIFQVKKKSGTLVIVREIWKGHEKSRNLKINSYSVFREILILLKGKVYSSRKNIPFTKVFIFCAFGGWGVGGEGGRVLLKEKNCAHRELIPVFPVTTSIL